MWVSSRCTSHRLTARGVGTEQPGRCRGKAGAAKAQMHWAAPPAPLPPRLRPCHRPASPQQDSPGKLMTSEVPQEAARPQGDRRDYLYGGNAALSPSGSTLPSASPLPPLAPGLLRLYQELGRWKGRDPPRRPGLGSPHVHPGPEPSRTWPTLAGLSEPPWDPRG